MKKFLASLAVVAVVIAAGYWLLKPSGSADVAIRKPFAAETDKPLFRVTMESAEPARLP